MIFHYNNFYREIFLNMFVAYSFTYTMVSASFLRNVPISRYTKYNYSQICGFYSLGYRHCIIYLSLVTILLKLFLKGKLSTRGLYFVMLQCNHK